MGIRKGGKGAVRLPKILVLTAAAVAAAQPVASREPAAVAVLVETMAVHARVPARAA